jgi:hypothetical protein
MRRSLILDEIRKKRPFRAPLQEEVDRRRNNRHDLTFDLAKRIRALFRIPYFVSLRRNLSIATDLQTKRPAAGLGAGRKNRKFETERYMLFTSSAARCAN